MAKKKKVNLLQEIAESFKRKWENASLRDIVYVVSYFAAVALSYQLLMKAKGVIIKFKLLEAFKIIPFGVLPEFDESEYDETTLITSFVVGYIILKIDLDDVTAAANKIGTVIATYG